MSDTNKKSNSKHFSKNHSSKKEKSFSNFKHRNKNKSQSSHYSKSKPKKKPFTNKISDHFSKNDFACKETGKLRISLGLVGVLEELRGATQKRITILKGYECPEVAELKGQLKRNFHTQGLAADIQIANMSIQEVFKAAEALESISGIGLNIKENYVHIDTRKAERLVWVEEGEEEVPLTDSHRKQYLSD